jgi:hypothetical protein
MICGKNNHEENGSHSWRRQTKREGGRSSWMEETLTIAIAGEETLRYSFVLFYAVSAKVVETGCSVDPFRLSSIWHVATQLFL